VCWAELIQRLSRTRQVLLEQVDGLASVARFSAAADASGRPQPRWMMKASAWVELTSAEVTSVAAALQTGISAARQALAHASTHLHDELLHELHALEADLFHLRAGVWRAPLERWPIVAFLLSACCCLFLSASYHLFNCHSRWLNDVLLVLDYSGISILIAGSAIPPVFYGLYCDRPLANWYLAAILALSAASFAIGMYSGLKPSAFWRITRVLAYSFNACFSAVPCLHMLARWRGGEPMWPLCLPYLLAMLGLYALGTVIYTTQFPERYFPHRFDLYLSSHQLWHLIVFAAALLHFFATVAHYHWRTDHPCPA
jgi:channel protein (hemolysin III family)